MFFSPSEQQREKLLENLVNNNKKPGRRRPECRAGGIGAKINEWLARPFRLSPFTFLIKRKNYAALFHSLSLGKLFGDERLVQIHRLAKSRRPSALQDFLDILRTNEESDPSRELELLICGGFIIPVEADSLMPLKRMQGDCSLNHAHIGLLYLLLSNDCNLRCRYCTIESAARKPQHFAYDSMSGEMAQRGIDLFLQVLHKDAKEPQVIYYGGEPLLNWKAFHESLSYIRKQEEKGLFNGEKVQASVVCNGTLVTEEIAQEMRELLLSASISLDGLRHHHDKMRIFRDGRGSWEDSLRGYFLIKRNRGGCGISCTLGPHNIKDIEEIAEFFAAHLECRALGFNIMKGLPRDNPLEVSVKKVTQQIIRAYEIFRKYGVYEDRIMRKINAFVYEAPWLHDCGGYGGQIALCADGAIGPCHIAADDHRFFWGHIDEPGMKDRILEGKLTRDFFQRSPVKMEACFDCVGLGLCGGGCAEEAYMKSGDIYALDESFCIHCKALVEWMFDDLAEKLRQSGDLGR
jgi:uncharacterized protein